MTAERRTTAGPSTPQAAESASRSAQDDSVMGIADFRLVDGIFQERELMA